MADTAEASGLNVAEMPIEQQKYLKELIPFAGVRNPVDVTAQALNDLTLIKRFMESMMQFGGYDAVVAFFTVVAGSRVISEQLIETLKDIREQYINAPMILSIVAPDDIVRDYEKAGYTILEDPARAVRAAAALIHFGTSFEKNLAAQAPALSPNVMQAPDTLQGEDECRKILASAGIPMANSELARTAKEAVSIWQGIKAPVALKIVSSDILHKTEMGGVALNLNNTNDIENAFNRITEAGKTHYPNAEIDGVIVSEMITDGVETVLGVINDPIFGPAVMFGLGGVFVEVLGDVTFRLAPFDITEAHRMISEIKGIKMLHGARGAQPSDINSIAEALVNLSVFAHENAEKISSIDINPFMVRPNGEGAAGVDALIIPNGVEVK